ncbi:MAG: nucleotidyl transferase AbiEii/AbiGii toxin family protein [Patescibacteria group bacterium]|mgnify:CR=1 FL=1
MAAEKILTQNQKKVLEAVSTNSGICRDFYLTGGIALAGFYLHHRLSEDLDFFSEKEVDSQAIFIFFKSISKKCGFKKVDFKQSFNRNLFFLHFKNGEIIKTEFTYYPFPRIERKNKISWLFIDSLIDIAVNKIFTIYQNPRSRDFIDLYFILKDKKWRLDGLIKKAKIKFDWHIDPIQLGSQLLRVREVKDYPRMIKEINPNEWQKFFVGEAKKIDKQIFK